MKHADGQVPLRRIRRRIRGGSGGSAGECHRGGRWECSSIASDECASKVLFDVVSSRSALSGPENDAQQFAHLQSIIDTDIGREESGRGMTALLQSSLTALGKSAGRFAWAWLGGGAMRQWRRRLKEVNREVSQFGVAVPGGVEHVIRRAINNLTLVFYQVYAKKPPSQAVLSTIPLTLHAT